VEFKVTEPGLLMYSNEKDVLDQLQAIGLIVDLPLRLSSGKKSVRCKVDGGDHEKRGWYRLHEWMLDSGEVLLVGSYGIWQGDDPGTRLVELTKRCEACGHDGISLKAKTCPACDEKTFKSRELTPEQLAAMKQRQAEDKKRADAERKAEISQAAQWASAVWRKCEEIQPHGHGYLVKKKLTGTGGARVFRSNDGINLNGAEKEDYEYLARFHGALVVPMCDQTGSVFGLQFILDREIHKDRIARTGRDKDYWPAGLSKDGHYWLIGGLPGRVCLDAEGFATGMSLYEATGLPVAIAFDAGNLPKVAQAIKNAHKRTRQLICADDDWLQKCHECKAWTPVSSENCQHCGKPHKKQNAGKARASEAALAVDGAWIAPAFSEQRPVDRKGPTDFNDLHELEGIQVVRAQINAKLVAMGIADHAAPVKPLPSASGSAKKGGGDKEERKAAQSVMDLDDIVERFIPLDDGTGDYVFDTWTRRTAKRSQMIALLPAGVRSDDIKRHPLWISRGAYFLDEVGFDPSLKNAKIKLNTWQGWPMTPVRGVCDNILDHLRYLVSKEENAQEVLDFILDSLALPLQQPGTKLASAMIFHGDQGSGKSLVFDTVMSKIYGDAFKKISQRRIENQFTDWARNRLFVVIEEISASSDIWHIKGEFKDMVTSDTFDINDKNEKWVEQRNMINFVLLSNEQMPIPLENGDRRHLVVYTPPKPSDAYISGLVSVIEDEIPHFYAFLMDRDLSNFHRHKRPPMTTSKQRLINISLPSEAVFINEWIDGQIEYNGQAIPFCPCLGTDLYSVYSAWAKRHNIARPRDIAKFIGYISSLPGWEAGKAQPTYDTLNSAEKKNRKMVVPSDEAIQKAELSNLQSKGGVLSKGNGHKNVWLTEGFFKFRNALGAAQ
jgi:putative DNA primase/helicase